MTIEAYPNAIERYSNVGIICPHCETLEMPEGAYDYDERRTDFECEHCGKVSTLEIYTTTSWRTRTRPTPTEGPTNG